MIRLTSLFLITILFLAILDSCTSDYEMVEATIIKTEDPNDQNRNFRATVEYYVDSVRYTDVFEVPFERMLKDSISTPAEGIVFDILYDSDDPQKTKIEFNVKAIYK